MGHLQRTEDLEPQSTQTVHEPSLYRILRLLAALGVFVQDDSATFGLTVVGERLRTDAPAGLRSWATFLDAIDAVRGFEHILDTVRTGRSGFETAHGTRLFEWLDRHPEKSAVFDAAMSERTAAFASSVATGHDFSDTRTVVDVGGGQATLLLEILRRHTHLEGVLFELPAVATRAGAVIEETDVADRCQAIAGDFFCRVPEGADRYVLANVLHDWNDTEATTILTNCRRAMANHGRVLIVERRIPQRDDDPVPALLSDINMLVITGGRERTDSEYAQLLDAAGLTLGSIKPATFPYCVIEGLPARRQQ